MIRVLLADDEHLIRGALAALLGLEPDLAVVAETGEGHRVLELALKHRPDVAVIDVNMPDVNGLQVAAHLAERCPSCRVLLLTSLGHPGTVRQALALKVSGYLKKDAAPAELSEAIRRVVDGQRVISPELLLAAWESDANPLTTRETEVLQLWGEGMGVREIAARIHLSTGTVRNYLSGAVSKLGARNRLDAYRMATAAGWLLLPEAPGPACARPLPSEARR